MSEYVIDASKLEVSFGPKQALAGLNLQVAAGGIHALIGSNGAGKSTLFKVLLGFLTADSGESFVLGECSTALNPNTRGRIGYVNEEHTLPGWLKTKDLLQMQKRFYPQWNDAVYDEVIANYDIGKQQKVADLSRGERAGFNLAMALAQSPDLLILDEPTLGLDVVAKQEFLDAIVFCREIDTTVIYCSHQMDEIERLADQLVIVESGRVSVTSTPDDFGARITSWLVDNDHQLLIESKLDDILFGRVIEDRYEFFVLDAPREFDKQLRLLGVADVISNELGLASAVRAYLASNHHGLRSDRAE
ncbi:MAG: hypothetical protein DHS20C12_30260 [Pseudohongiella sp.]|nr:MAG: hypothetical protein DHS20C12_30260 [Pseudohongiella sp.]